MASIKNVTIKSVKTAMGMEGPFRQGNIYLDGKKVGFFSEDPHGGCAYADYLSKEAKEEIAVKVKEYFEENPPEFDFANTAEYFFIDILDLVELEREYKKAVKKGYVAILDANSKYDFGVTKPRPVPQVYFLPQNYLEENKYNEFIKELEEKGYDKCKLYRSLDNFVI